MDEYQHMERFGMENDYTGARWIDGEFYYKERKVKKRQTKDEALYGYDDSDSDAEDYSRRKRRGGDIIKKGDLTKPVNFVSTGTVKPSDEIEKVDKDRVDFCNPDLGSGSTSGSGLGFRGPAFGDEEMEDLLPSAFGKRILESAERKQREREKERTKMSSSKGRSSASSLPPELAEFEKHTRGIGSKLLEKMGYKGGGLGKNAQGIAVPLEAKQRPKNMGMGFSDYQETSVHLSGPSLVEYEEVKVKEVKPKEKFWLKKFWGRKKDYKTAEDLLTEKSEQSSEPVQTTILDMRGPQVRVLTNLEHLNSEQNDIEDEVPEPELQHNLRLIVDLVEADIHSYDRKLRHAKESVVIFEKERTRLSSVVNCQRGQIEALEMIMSAIQMVQHKITAGSLSLEDLAIIFSDLQRDHKEEYKMHNLSAVALSFALPLMSTAFRNWEPLLQPLHGTDIVRLWQGLLQGDSPIDFSVFADAANMYGGSYGSSPYIQLIVEAIFPSIRFAATNTWEPRDPEPMLRFLEIWQKLLPSSVLQSILEHLVLPKLTVAVDAWDPRKEMVPIHAWLHPWLPLLGQRMESLYHPIRYKLGDALRAWHPSDSSAFALLSPWQTVFDPGSWEQLVVHSIVPKLMGALQELVINPQAQKLDQFNWVMTWAAAVPIQHVSAMLEAGFFPKWHQVLYHWLCTNPNFEEVTQWYLGWKSLFTPELLANERIRLQLQVALDMMDQAVEGYPVAQPGARENVSYLRVTEKRQFETQQAAAAAAAAAAYAQQQASVYGKHARENGVHEMSLKEVVETFAEQNDVQFIPKIGRSYEGLQVYGFGSTSVCVDSAQQKLFAQTGDRWAAVSLEQLLEIHQSHSSRWK